MAESYFPFDAGPGAAVLESEWQRMARQWLTTGVIAGFRDLLAVSANGGAMQVFVAPGAVWVEGFWYDTDTALTRAIDAADATNPRIDTVVARLDRTANSITVAVVKGAPVASPVPPTLSQTDTLWEVALADVRVPAATGVINAADVTDRRVYAKAPHQTFTTDLTTVLLFGAS